MNARAPRQIRQYASSLTTIASKLAPTGMGSTKSPTHLP
ncbi:alpha/beta hydrolase, partial [Pseudomonas sp. FW215-T2]